MTERLYYTDPGLLEFEATVAEARDLGGRTALVLDRSAFYPTSGGQLFDTGALEAGAQKLAVSNVEEAQDGTVLHVVDIALPVGTRVRGRIDAARRRDHRQQHSGQHVLSAVFVELFNLPTVSFHMGAESCTIDLDARKLTAEQVRRAEQRANAIIADDRPVRIHFKSRAEAESLGVRKIAPELPDPLRLIEIEGIEYNACGGTHVGRTGEIGGILLRKTENVKQGARVEFVCGGRAVAAARRDFETLTDAAALLSAHIHDLPQQVRKLLDEAKSAGKREKTLLEALAGYRAAEMLSAAPERNGMRVVRARFADQDVAFVKLLAQKIAAATGAGTKVVALLGAGAPQPTAVFSQPQGGRFDLGALMKDLMAKHGGRGGGNRDMAQGGVADVSTLDAVLGDAEKFVMGNL